MKNLKVVSVLILLVCMFSTLSYGQNWKDRFKQHKIESHSGGEKVTAKNSATAKPSIISSVLSTKEGMEINFKVAGNKITRILLYRNSKEDNKLTFVKSITPNRKKQNYSFTDPARNLSQANEYCYIIKTWVKGQTTGTPSTGNANCQFFDGQFKTPSRPKNPTDLKVSEVSSNSATLTFIDRSTNEKYFFLERKAPHHKDWTVTAVQQVPKRDRGGNSQISIKNESLEMEQSYQYRVRAVNNAGSSLSNTIQVKTFPLEVGNANIQITHPSNNTLQVAWLYTEHGKPDWEVSLYDINDDQNPIMKNHVKANQKRMTAFTNLNPSKQYCIVVRKKGSTTGYQKVCDSPFARRSSIEDKGPIVPTIQSIERVSSSILKVHLKNGMEGQMVDLVNMDTGRRETVTLFNNGTNTLTLTRLGHGDKYCIRMLMTNEYGTRYSASKCQFTLIDTPSRPYVESISDDHVITLEWNTFGSDENTFEYTGTKSGAPNHSGIIKLDPPYDFIEFQAKPNYSYCFRVRSKNEYHQTDWSESLCGIISEKQEEVVSFSSSLVADIPNTGNVIYLGQVTANNSRLRKVHVAGNAFTPYIVQFLPLGKSSDDCGSNIGVFIEPGSDLTGADLNTLYGSNEPKTPVYFGACKVARPDKQIDTSRIPVQIEYVKE